MRLASFSSLKKAVNLLKKGQLVVLPTETVYGLAADAFNPKAIKKIFTLKKRPLFDPLIVHLHDPSQLNSLVKTIPPIAKRLMEKFWPGPLTLILPAHPNISKLITAHLPTIAVRMPNHPIAAKLLKLFGNPLAAPSANRFGYISPTSLDAVKKEFGKKTPFSLQGGKCQLGLESTIIHFQKNEPIILRVGSITPEQIEKVLKHKIKIQTKTVLKHPLAPGQLARHYAPRTRLILLPEKWRQQKISFPKKSILLLFQKPFSSFTGSQYFLTKHGSLKEAAKNLYHFLRKLDEKKASKIYAELVPNRGLGITINDRLKKAAYKFRKIY